MIYTNVCKHSPPGLQRCGRVCGTNSCSRDHNSKPLVRHSAQGQNHYEYNTVKYSESAMTEADKLWGVRSGAKAVSFASATPTAQVEALTL